MRDKTFIKSMALGASIPARGILFTLANMADEFTGMGSEFDDLFGKGWRPGMDELQRLGVVTLTEDNGLFKVQLHRPNQRRLEKQRGYARKYYARQKELAKK